MSMRKIFVSYCFSLHSNATNSLHAMRLGFLLLLVCGVFQQAHAAVSSTGDVFPNPPIENSSLQIGIGNYGTFRIDDGSVFESSFVGIGQGSGGFGKATVTDEGSLWNMSGVVLGSNGIGQLDVLAGGVAVVGGTLNLGDGSNGRGTLNVNGLGSLLQANSQLEIGQSGSGYLNIGDGGTVNVSSGQTRIGSAGRVQLDEGLLRTDSLENRGVIGGTGTIEVACCGSTENYGRLHVGPGDHLQLRSFSSNNVRNQGDYLIHGGELEILTRVQNESFGQQQQAFIELSEGTLRVGIGNTSFGEQHLINRGLVAAIKGENHIYGSVRNDSNSEITVVNNSLLMFHHTVSAQHNSTMSVFAGSTAIFLQDLILNGGTLLADLTGATGFGHVEVVGDFEFFGNLMVNLAESYTPQLGDSFPLVKVSGSITGSPNTQFLPALSSGLAWDVRSDPHELVLSVIETPGLSGDFDHDGDVDGRDFLTWQRDPNVGNLADWDANYGAPGNLSSVHAVPEPSCAAMLITVFGLLNAVRRNLYATKNRR